MTEEFVLADIPGLIEGAHEGAGLGDRFLGHVERCAVLLHLIDGAAGDVVRAWRTVREELAAYGGGLAEKPELIGLNKADAMTAARGRRAAQRRCERASGRPVMLLSGVDRPGRAGGAAGAAERRSRDSAAGGRRREPAVPRLADARRLVVKIGSALVVDPDEGRRRATGWLAGVAADIAALRARGIEVIVVSSGAIALARRTLGLTQQAAAAGGEAGRRRGRPDPAGAGLERGAVGHRA